MKVSVILSTALCGLVASVNAMPLVGVRAASDANNTDSTPPAMDSQVVRAGSDITNPERNNSSPTMAVTGQGSVDISTDLIRVDVTVSQNLVCDDQFADDCNAGQLQKDVNKKLDKILQLQKSNSGIQSMQTQGLGLTTNYQWINNTQEFTGYKSSVQLVSIVKNSAFGQLIDDLLKNGVKSIDNTQYYITYDQRRDAQKKWLTIATENAVAQADTILGAMGKARTDIKSIEIPYSSDPFVGTQVSPGTSLDESSPVTNGLLTVSYRVKMRVGY